mmetsp:Transcript_4495/g.15917  ORF Transcript_4495/g.15917 Transcript_4495/m.15917 type:complete len:410 (+) Transcript_4495:690-1919(+)
MAVAVTVFAAHLALRVSLRLRVAAVRVRVRVRLRATRDEPHLDVHDAVRLLLRALPLKRRGRGEELPRVVRLRDARVLPSEENSRGGAGDAPAGADHPRVLPRALRAPRVQHRHPVEDDHERGADVRDDSLPQPGVPHQGQNQHDRLRDDAEDDVLLDLLDAQTPDGDSLADAREVVRQQRDVRGLHRGGRAGDAHGDAHVRGPERGRVVDAVADHRERASPREPPPERSARVRGAFERPDALDDLLHLPRRGQTRVNVRLVDPNLGRDPLRAAFVIPRQHDDLGAKIFQPRHRARGGDPRRVFASQRAGDGAVDPDPHHSRALPLPRRHRARERGVVVDPPAPRRERGTADLDEPPVHRRGRALAREGGKVADVARLRGDAHRGARAREDRARDRVRRAEFERARPAE